HQSGHQLEERALAAAARSHQGDELVLPDGEGGLRERLDGIAPAGAIGLGDAVETDHAMGGRAAAKRLMESCAATAPRRVAATWRASRSGAADACALCVRCRSAASCARAKMRSSSTVVTRPCSTTTWPPTSTVSTLAPVSAYTRAVTGSASGRKKTEPAR